MDLEHWYDWVGFFPELLKNSFQWVPWHYLGCLPSPTGRNQSGSYCDYLTIFSLRLFWSGFSSGGPFFSILQPSTSWVQFCFAFKTNAFIKDGRINKWQGWGKRYLGIFFGAEDFRIEGKILTIKSVLSKQVYCFFAVLCLNGGGGKFHCYRASLSWSWLPRKVVFLGSRLWGHPACSASLCASLSF